MYVFSLCHFYEKIELNYSKFMLKLSVVNKVTN